MKKLFIGWDLKRIFYLVGGLGFIALSIFDRVWWIGLFGVYYAAMAIFKFGCASGSCQVDLKENKTEKIK